MRLSVIMPILACLALASSSEFDKGSDGTSLNQMPMALSSKMKNIFSDIHKTMTELKNARTTIKHRCIWKICSRPVQRPELVDHLRGSFKSILNWWNNMFPTKQFKQIKMARDQ